MSYSDSFKKEFLAIQNIYLSMYLADKNNDLFFTVVSCLTLATFWTHPSSSHRIRLGCLNLFILIFMLAEARTRLPMAGSQLPLVGKSGYDLSRRDLYIVLTVQ